MASNFGSDVRNNLSIKMLHRFTSAMYISLVALDEFWVDTTLLSMLTYISYPSSTYIPHLNLGSVTFILSFELHSCLNNIIHIKLYNERFCNPFRAYPFCQA